MLGFSTSLWAVAAEPDGSRSEYDEAVELESQDIEKEDVVDTPETSLEQPVESLDTFDTDNLSKTVVQDNRSDDVAVDIMMTDDLETSVELDVLDVWS